MGVSPLEKIVNAQLPTLNYQYGHDAMQTPLTIET